jgi:hypothetical protein
MIIFTNIRSGSPLLCLTHAVACQIHGEGTYIYKKTNDVFSGTWVDGIKSGEGSYQVKSVNQAKRREDEGLR